MNSIALIYNTFIVSFEIYQFIRFEAKLHQIKSVINALLISLTCSGCGYSDVIIIGITILLLNGVLYSKVIFMKANEFHGNGGTCSVHYLCAVMCPQD